MEGDLGGGVVFGEGVEFEDFDGGAVGDLDEVFGDFAEVGGGEACAGEGVGGGGIEGDELDGFGSEGGEEFGGGAEGGGLGMEGGECAGGGLNGEGFAIGVGEGGGEEVGFTDEVSDETVDGLAVELGGGALLLEDAEFHDGDAVGHGEGFFLVMGDVDGGDAGFFADAADFGAHFEAEFGVEVGEGFVEEHTFWAEGDGAGEGDALLLTAGELVGFAVAEVGHLDEFEGLVDASGAFLAFDFADIEAEADVVADGHVGPECVGLEDHAGVAFVGWYEGHVLIVEADVTVGGEGEAGDHAEEGGFAAAGGAEEEEECAGGDGEVDVIDGGEQAGGLFKAFGDVLDVDSDHNERGGYRVEGGGGRGKWGILRGQG